MLKLPEYSLSTINTIHCMDSLCLLRGLATGSVDCVVTSPPYNLRNSTGNGLKNLNNKSLWSNQPMRNGYDGVYTDDRPHHEYIDWQRACLVEMMRITKRTGAVFYNHKWRVQDGVLQRLADEITQGFPVRQIIIWDRCGGINFNDGYFLPSYEVVYLLAQPEFELQPKTSGLKDVWTIPPAEGKEHPNAYPVELAENCIRAGSPANGLVCDPFMGSGTTAIAARNLRRAFIGSEINRKYIEYANARLNGTHNDKQLEDDRGNRLDIVQKSMFTAAS
jgi:site-specific DNA-methyltransferase (adenine-specific)